MKYVIAVLCVLFLFTYLTGPALSCLCIPSSLLFFSENLFQFDSAFFFLKDGCQVRHGRFLSSSFPACASQVLEVVSWHLSCDLTEKIKDENAPHQAVTFLSAGHDAGENTVVRCREKTRLHLCMTLWFVSGNVKICVEVVPVLY